MYDANAWKNINALQSAREKQKMDFLDAQNTGALGRHFKRKSSQA